MIRRHASDFREYASGYLAHVEVLAPHRYHHLGFAGAGLHRVRDDRRHVVHDVRFVIATDQPLAGVDGVLRVELPLPFRLMADQLVALLIDGEDGRYRAGTVTLRHKPDLPALVGVGGAAVGGAEVDSDYPGHDAS